MNMDRLQRERQLRGRMAPLSAAAAVLLVVSVVISFVGPQTHVNEVTLGLIFIDKRFPLDLVGAVINAGGLLALTAVITFLWQATRARKPDVSIAFRSIAIAGGLLAGIGIVVYQVLSALIAHRFVTTGLQTYSQAHDLTSSTPVLLLPLVILAGEFLLAIATVLICLNAMRVGLLPKVMGYLGIASGILFVFQIGAPGVVIQAGWLGGVAYLLFGRWPSGHPPAWTSGEAVPWPSSQQVREQRPRPARGGGRGKPVPAPAPEPAVAPAVGATRATTPKRKRKRRK